MCSWRVYPAISEIVPDQKSFLVFCSCDDIHPSTKVQEEVAEWLLEHPEANVLQQSINTDGKSYYIASFLVELPVL
jgi:hypothetical protein